MTRFPLVWFLAGILAGIGLGAAGAGWPVGLVLPLAGLLLILTVCRRLTLIMLLLPGMAAGWLAVGARPLPVLPGELALRRQFFAVALIGEQLAADRYGATLDWQGMPVPLLLELADSMAPAPGDALLVTGEVRVPPGERWPGGFDYRAHLARNGYAGLARVRTAQLLRAGDEPWRARLWRARRTVREHTRAALGLRGDWAVAFFFGEQSGLEPDEQQHLQVAGLGHILAVSGLNVGIVAWLAAGAGFFLPRWPRLLWTGAAVAAYALLVGFQPSVTRAALMLLAALIPPFLSRPVIGVHTVSLAAVIILLADPWSLYAPGFQLSFGVAFFLVWTAVNWPRCLTAWWGAPALAAVAQLAAIPLMLQYFNFVSPAALPVNIILLPTFAWLLVWAALVLLPLPAVAAPAAWLFGAHVDGLLAVAELGESCWRHVNAPAPPAWWPGLFYAGLLLVLWPGARRGWRWLLAAGLTGLLALPLLAKVPPAVDICDVGLGDAVLLHGRTQNVLIDAGPATGARLLLQQLRGRGVNRLDRIIITHPDEDHCGGLPLVLMEMPAGEVLHGGWAGEDTAAAAVAAAVTARGVPQRLVMAPTQLPWPGGDLTVIPPGGASANDRSLVVRLVAGGQSFLFAADIEEEGVARLLAANRDLRADILKLPHHGAQNEKLDELLAAVQPQEAIVTAPLINRFNFPHRTTLAALAARGIPHRQTGTAGRISYPLFAAD